MPNWCDNSMRLHHEDKTKIDALEAEMSKKNADGHSMAQPFQHLHPNPTGEWEYDWSVSNWGTKWDANIIDWSRDDDNELTIYCDTAWGPPIALYDHLVENGWNVEALYHEPGMAFAGMYSNGNDDCYEYDVSDKDSIDNLPSDIVEFAGLENSHREWMISELDTNWADAERTDWISAETPPIRDGWYEVSTTGWEFAHFMEFSNGSWDCYDPKDVIKWRGLTEMGYLSDMPVLDGEEMQAQESIDSRA